MRESLWRKIDPQPRTVAELNFFTSGSQSHKALQDLVGADVEVEVEKFGVVGHVDLVEKEIGKFIPVEIKTTRSRSEELPEHYFTQLLYYCVLLGINRGRLVVQRILNKDDPFEFYDVEWSEDEMKEMSEELEYKASLFQKALQKKDPYLLPRVHEKMKWKCRYCKYSSRCQNT